MASNLQPLTNNQKIVKPDGTPTDYFIRWAQNRQMDVGGGVTMAQVEQAIADWSEEREVNAGTGLSGGGNLGTDITINLENTAVEPGTYGGAAKAAVITVDQHGRITDASEADIVAGIPEAPNNGQQYVRKNEGWSVLDVPVDEAPEDGRQYGRQDGEWTEVVHPPFPPIPPSRIFAPLVNGDLPGPVLIATSDGQCIMVEIGQ